MITHAILKYLYKYTKPRYQKTAIFWRQTSSITLTHFPQSSKMKTVTKRFDAKLVNRPFKYLTFSGLSVKVHKSQKQFKLENIGSRIDMQIHVGNGRR